MKSLNSSHNILVGTKKKWVYALTLTYAGVCSGVNRIRSSVLQLKVSPGNTSWHIIGTSFPMCIVSFFSWLRSNLFRFGFLIATAWNRFCIIIVCLTLVILSVYAREFVEFARNIIGLDHPIIPIAVLFLRILFVVLRLFGRLRLFLFPVY